METVSLVCAIHFPGTESCPKEPRGFDLKHHYLRAGLSVPQQFNSSARGACSGLASPHVSPLWQCYPQISTSTCCFSAKQTRQASPLAPAACVLPSRPTMQTQSHRTSLFTAPLFTGMVLY